MFQPDIRREIEKQRSRDNYQQHKKIRIKKQKIYNQNVDYSKNKIYKHNYYLEQKRKTKVSNQIKLLGKTNTNESNTGLNELIRNMKSRKYQKQKRNQEVNKRNLLFEFKLLHGDKEPYVYLKTKTKPFYCKLKKRTIISFY